MDQNQKWKKNKSGLCLMSNVGEKSQNSKPSVFSTFSYALSHSEDDDVFTDYK